MMKRPGMFSCREVHEHASMEACDDLGMMARLRFRLHRLMCVHCARCARLEAAVMAHCDGHEH